MVIVLELGCFSSVGIHIDTSSEGGPHDYEVTFRVGELKRVTGNISTMVGTQEGSLVTGVKFPNLQGRGERFEVEYTHGYKKSSTLHARYIKPFHDDNRTVLTTAVFQQMGEYPASGFKELNRGANVDLSFSSAPGIQHSLQYEPCWRDLRCIGRSSAFEVRRHTGHTLKSALRHVLTVDRRDSFVFPSEGTLFVLSQEYAGLGGNVGFFKNDIQLQANVPLVEDISLQASFNAGVLKSLASGGKGHTIADKFFLGGPQDIRGFEMRGCGHQADGNALGSDMFWASGLHLWAPLPFRAGRGGFGELFRTHAFVTAGNLGKFSPEAGLNTNVEELLQNFRLSYGLGLALQLGGIARIELNYCVPVKAQRGDKIAPGLQFGIGFRFL